MNSAVHILCHLLDRSGWHSALDICKATGVGRTAASVHLNELAKVGLVDKTEVQGVTRQMWSIGERVRLGVLREQKGHE